MWAPRRTEGRTVAYREDSLRMPLGSHVGVMDLLQYHPGLIMLPILEPQKQSPHLRVSPSLTHRSST